MPRKHSEFEIEADGCAWGDTQRHRWRGTLTILQEYNHKRCNVLPVPLASVSVARGERTARSFGGSTRRSDPSAVCCSHLPGRSNTARAAEKWVIQVSASSSGTDRPFSAENNLSNVQLSRHSHSVTAALSL